MPSASKLSTGAVAAWVATAVLLAGPQSQPSPAGSSPTIPKTWDDAAMASLEVPLADARASAVHVPADYYYRVPVRPIYKSYPTYAPGREPPGYLEWLGGQEPVVLWDDGARRTEGRRMDS